MAYPNYFAPYQPTIPGPMDRLQQLQQPYQMPPVQQPQQGQGILWVQGEAAARAYLVAPGTSVLLMDSDDSAFYIKTVDGAGMPQPLRTFRYTEVGQNPAPPVKNDTQNLDDKYVTRHEYDELKGKYEELYDMLETATK